MAGITRETFEEMDMDSKLLVLFDYVHEIQESAPERVEARNIKCAEQIDKYDKKFEIMDNKLGKQRVINMGIVLAGSFVGGWSAVWTGLKLSIF